MNIVLYKCMYTGSSASRVVMNICGSVYRANQDQCSTTADSPAQQHSVQTHHLRVKINFSAEVSVLHSSAKMLLIGSPEGHPLLSIPQVELVHQLQAGRAHKHVQNLCDVQRTSVMCTVLV